MADRYFDRNGVTAGFGTLTGAWDTTTASWSTSSAGTATPATFTFSSADAAFFGSAAVASTTAGTATIATGVTVTLNGIYARNLTAQQNIAATGTGAIVLAGTSPFVYVGSAFAHSLNISAPVSGTAGIIAQALNKYAYTQLVGNTSGLSGTCDVQSGQLVVSRAVAAYTPAALAVGVDARFIYVDITADYDFPVVPTGDASAIVQCNGNMTGTNGVTYPVGIGAFAGYIGTRVITVAGYQLSKFRFSELPSGLFYGCRAISSAVTPQALATYTGTGETKSTRIVIESDNNTSVATLTAATYALYANGTGPMVLTGTVQRTNEGIGGSPGNSGRMSLTLGGSNTGDNTLSGVISEPYAAQLAILGLRKVDAGRWVLSGNNTHTGQHEIVAGTLSAQSATALGAATQATSNTFAVSGSGVLELSGGISLNKSGTDISLTNTNNPVQSVGGTNTLRSKQLSLASSATTTFNVGTGNKLVLQTEGGGVIVGTSAGLTKSGDGELELPAKANSYNGTVTVSAGTLTVGSVANSGFPAAWGQGSTAVDVFTTLRYNGSGGSTTRSVRMNGTNTPTIDASGTGALVLNSVTQDTNAKTMTLRGTNTDANTISSLIANNSGAVSLAKEDAGRWVLNGGLAHTGTTTVNGGTLRVETGNNNTASGAVTIGASGTVELITDTLASTSASSGEVLGTGNVTVNGGTIKTRGGTTQKGQVRYGGNLTFGTGSKLYIGAAA